MPNSGLAIAMDAVPEALVLGLVLHAHGPDAALIAAITLGNLPEAMSASAGMRHANRSYGWILRLWGWSLPSASRCCSYWHRLLSLAWRGRLYCR